MKVLTLWEPYATLVALGLKRFETRSWSTPYRGLVLIHASKHWKIRQAEICQIPAFRKALEWAGIDPAARPETLGRVLAVAELVAVHHAERLDRSIDHRERAFGDFTPGRFAWELRNVRRIADPIPFRGMQGLIDAPRWLVDQVERTYGLTPAAREAVSR